MATFVQTTDDEIFVRLIQGQPKEMDELQRVLEAAPEFALRTTGCLPTLSDAQSTYSGMPDGKSYDDKFVFGIYSGSTMVGCIDVIRAYPAPKIAWIGLFLVVENRHGFGIGKRAYLMLEEEIRKWGLCDRIQLAVVTTNSEAMPFWQKMGFTETGVRKPYQYNSVVAESVFMEKELISE